MAQPPPITEITVDEARAFRQGRPAALAGGYGLHAQGTTK